MECAVYNGQSLRVAPSGWIQKEVLSPIHDEHGVEVGQFVTLHYPDGTSEDGMELFNEAEGAVEMPPQSIDSLFEEKLKQIRNDRN